VQADTRNRARYHTGEMNMDINVKGGKLTITIDMAQERGMSSTGRTIIVETSGGWLPIPGTDMVLNFNLVKSLHSRKASNGRRLKRVA
jgi:hypothetical protein